MRAIWLMVLVFLSTSVMATPAEPVAGLVIHMKTSNRLSGHLRQLSSEQFGAQHGVAWKHLRVMALDADVVRLPKPISAVEAQALIKRLQRDPAVDWVAIDGHRHVALEPDDTEFTNDYPAITCSSGDTGCVAYPALSHLWYLQALDTSSSLVSANISINLEAAWDQLFGVAATIAVVDTGILPHSDLDTQRILAGYDFISDETVGNNGHGRDADPSDPGDWVSESDLSNSEFSGCTVSDSSWHGTFVTGVLSATASNAFGIAGVNPKANVLPVRVLGKCGGIDSDIVDGMLWAGGVSVSGVTDNPNPAAIINLSLGGEGACTTLYQNAINTLVAKGVLVVVAAGNSSEDVSGFTPAGCQNVVTVAATARSGYLTYYSNYGGGVQLSAPGGGSTYEITSTSNSGTTSPSSVTTTLKQERGTSFSTPLTGGVASLLIGRNSSLSISQVEQALYLSATPFPAGSDCDSRHCGHGVVNAAAALLAANHSLTVAPTRLDFGTVAVNASSALAVVITNTGSASEAIGTTALETAIGEPADFSAATGCSANTLAPNGVCTIHVTFTPSAQAGRYAVLDVPLSDTTLHVPLYGVGTVTSSVITLSPDPTTALVSSNSVSVTLTNSSAQGVVLNSESVSGATVSNVACSGGTTSSLIGCHLGGGATLTFTLTRSSQASGSFSLASDVGGSVKSAWSGGASASTSSSSSGGGCTAVSGRFDIGLLLLVGCAAWMRRRQH